MVFSRRFLVWLWFGLIAVVWLGRGLPWHLDDYDQAKQAYTSYEMVERGAWWFQHTPRQDAATKPPLVGWLSAGIYQVTDSWDAAWRLPPLLAGAGLLILLWRSGWRVAGHEGAMLATAVFAWNYLTPRLATLVRTDMVQAAFIFAAGWSLWRRLQRAEAWTGRDTAGLTLLLAGATLTKGPIYHAFLLPGLLAWLALAGPVPGKWPMARGYLVAAVISVLPFLLWTWLRMRQDPAFYDQVVVKEFLGRFTTGPEAVHRNQPWYFYLPHLLARCFPWSVLLLWVMARRETRAALRENAALLWLVCWLAGGLVVMSAVPSKRVDRIFPLVPVAALLLASCLPVLKRSGLWSPRVLASLTWIVAGGLTLEAGYQIWRGYQTVENRLVLFGRAVRERCAELGWNYEIIEGRDEGLVMYAGKVVFSDVRATAAQLREGTISAVVGDAARLDRLAEKVGPLETVLEVRHPTDESHSYRLVRPAGGNVRPPAKP